MTIVLIAVLVYIALLLRRIGRNFVDWANRDLRVRKA